MSSHFEEFFGAEKSVLHDVGAQSHEISLSAGQCIFEESDPGNSVYYLIAGEARAIRYSVSGTEVQIATYRHGTLFGEMAALCGAARSAGVYALTDVKLAVFSGTAFLSLMEKHGSIGLRVSQMLAHRIRNTTGRMFEHATLSSKGRVYAELIRLSRYEGGGAAPHIKQPPSNSEIARRLSIARETVSRTMNELQDEGAIQRRADHLILLQPQLLVSRLSC